MHKPLTVLAILIGLISIGFAFLYWTTPGGALPHFTPGYEAGMTTIHFKHGLAALIVGIGAFIFAWFKSAPKVSA